MTKNEQLFCGYASVQVCVVLCNLLPELGDGGGEVGGVGSHPEGFVLAVGVLNAMISVPGLIALGPGQLRLKTLGYKKKNMINDDNCIITIINNNYYIHVLVAG